MPMRRSIAASVRSNETPSKIVKILIALALVIGLSPVMALAAPGMAYASTSGHLSVGNKISYGGWTTTHFAVNGNEAYCGNPSASTPSPGTYEMHEISDAALLAGLWFGYGGPGFDASMWPGSWYDGSGMTPDRYRALTHIVLSDIYAGDGHYAYGQCNSSFIRWCQDNVVGYSIQDGHVVNEGAVRYRIGSEGFSLNGAGDSYGDVPKGFTGYTMPTGGSTQVILTFEYHPYGSVEIRKASANPGITDNNGCYTLEGAVFGIFSDPQCTNLVRSMTCGPDGVARADEVLIGTYYVKELTAPRGYALAEEAHGIQVEAEQTTNVGVSDIPQNDPAYVCVQKYDGERAYFSHNLPQGSASLGGAEYLLKYYDGYFSTADEAAASGAPSRSWIIRTDDDGFAALDPAYVVSGDALYTNSAGTPTLPLGTLVIKEAKAPEGYLLDDATTYVQQITSEGHLETVYTYVTPVHPEQVIRGGVSIEKRDLESGLLTPLGGATLDGTEFKITNRSKNSVIVDGIDYAPGAVVATIYTKDGTASTASDALPYGHYSIQETAPSTGYLHTDTTERFFDITEDGAIVRIEGDKAPRNQVKRGDLELVKVRESDQHRLGGIPFKITSKTTGEAHVFVTDDNGEAKTEAAWNPHTQRTNANDSAVSADGSVDESMLDAEAGVWFGLTTEGWSVKADDKLGALPYDTYQIDELPCSANEGLELVSMTARVSRHGYQIDMGAVDDQPKGQVSVSTAARDGLDGDKEAFADTETTIIDRVEYAGVTVGTAYSVEGTLMDKATGSPVAAPDGTPVTATKEFTASSMTGYVELAFTFDALALGGHDVVAFERLVDVSTGTVVAEHEDIDDFDQTIKVAPPEIGTSAKDGLDGDHAVIADGRATVVDTVSYKGLTPGKEYIAKGTLMVVSDGSVKPLIGSSGEPVTVEAAFTPDKPTGSVDVTFSFDATLLAGERLVAFEQVLKADALIASHEDPEDPSQTVDVVSPRIWTLAFDGIDSDKRVVADISSKVVDRISYENLIPGRAYVAIGVIADPETGGVLTADGDPGSSDAVRLWDELKDALSYGEGTTMPRKVDSDRIDDILAEAQEKGVLACAKAEFTPDAQAGTVDAEFAFDATGLAGKAGVVFETLIMQDEGEATLVADHIDKESEEQSLDIVASEICTLATDKSDHDHNVLTGKDTVIVDAVSYTDLIPGLEYEVTGTLMDKATGKKALVGERPVTSSVMFTPNASAGTVEVEFAFDSTGLAENDLVVFERLTKDGAPVAEHEDLDDESQTVHVGDPELTKTVTSYYDKTGIDMRPVYTLIAVLAAGAAALAVYGVRKLRSSRQDADDALDDATDAPSKPETE